MVARFILWVYLFILELREDIYGTNTTAVAVVDKPEILKTFDQLKSLINDTPQPIKGIGYIDDFLFNHIETKFNNVGHVLEGLSTIRLSLGDQINDPVIAKPIEDDSIVLSDKGYKAVQLAFFQTHNGRDVAMKDSYHFIEKELDVISILLEQIHTHPDVDEYYLPYLERRLSPFLRELNKVLSDIKNIGKPNQC